MKSTEASTLPCNIAFDPSCMQMVCIQIWINNQVIRYSRELEQIHPQLRSTNSTNPEMAQALTQAATQVSSAIVAAFTPQSAAVSSGPSTSQTGISPAKIIHNRSKCYRQLTDLQNLQSHGLLSDEDYSRERDAIMGILKKLV